MGVVFQMGLGEICILVGVLVSIGHILEVDLLPYNIWVFYSKKLILEKSGINFKILIRLRAFIVGWAGGRTPIRIKIGTVSP